MLGKGMRPIGADGVSGKYGVDEVSVGDFSVFAAAYAGLKLILIKIAHEKVIAGCWLKIEAAKILLVIEKVRDAPLHSGERHDRRKRHLLQ